MASMGFYTIDLTTIVIILLIAMFIYAILNYNDPKKEENFIFNFGISIISGIIVSIMYSYFSLEPDEILTTNYWE